MDLIEEIKKAEAEVEKIKKRAEEEGAKRLTQISTELKQRLGAITYKKEEYIKESEQEIKKIVAEQHKIIEDEYIKKSKELSSKVKESKNVAIKKVQEIILKWQ